jgi:chaperonin GroEL
MLLRGALERAARLVSESLLRDAMPLEGRNAITHVALGMCQSDSCMAEMLGEVLDCVGSDGLIEVEGWQRLGMEREYIEGTYWKLSGWLSRLFTEDHAPGRASLDYPSILITDMDIHSHAMLIPVLEKCLAEDIRKLIIIAKSISDSTIGLLVNNNRARTIETIAVRTPKVADMDRVAAIEDIAVLTGGRPFHAAAFANFDDFRVDDLGHARRAWAMESLFGIHGSMGDAREIRERMNDIRGRVRLAETDHERRELQSRLGRMSGGTAILRVGAIHDTEREARKAVAERAIAGLRNAMQHGVVAGGGAALIHAQSALDDMPACRDEDRVAKKMLMRALEAPARAIAENAGGQPELFAQLVRVAPRSHGLDVCQMCVVDCREAGILDSAFVLQKALEIAVSGVALALTTDVIVHHRVPAESIDP